MEYSEHSSGEAMVEIFLFFFHDFSLVDRLAVILIMAF